MSLTSFITIHEEISRLHSLKLITTNEYVRLTAYSIHFSDQIPNIEESLKYGPDSVKIEHLKRFLDDEEQICLGKRSHSFSFPEPETQNSKRNKISFDSLLKLRKHISADKPPVLFISFVPHPDIQKQICDQICSNIFLVYGTNRTQDYQGINLSGGSGVGKTRIGFEIKNFITKDERIQTYVKKLKVTFKHIFISMKEILNFLGEERERDPETKIYPQIPEDFNKAENVLIMLIAIYFFAKVWTRSSIEKCKELISETMNYKEIIKLIRKEMKLDEDAHLVLILQIDDFQFSPYWTVVLLRIISYIVETNKTLIFSVCTGTEPSKISNLYGFFASQYRTNNINLPPINFTQFIKYYEENYNVYQLEKYSPPDGPLTKSHHFVLEKKIE
ncbi:uncharacterized protein OCT59_006355 [Rhizophagus irregularis]|uniref:Uncharacterized protein n=2 Tax=Rhizophagus irregularis TaxID=588596 RepID=U9U077_RHIID|nr:hypothetical protein GLOIN_2v1765471 [Rhizophagus irregularis DAOM 181602=DAOM 197198]EXX53506.1 hypothetical protein RirG_243270 [Rhizophagus irregularis DAOM 197198w]UZO14912.1 hypothetical protein OCT59_006355 [Rhizophagus irregularis]POG79513.1 hypothetical protein GLOIN_2v1765471 [Rhizophagus irregularis DAOM 181602=DAOM 197198]CAG8719800.1 4747_t:CDS:2 [Rhizophagus irregularis]GBC18289.1 hypothetical protein GLOIN_2v1765471 [Rhizophagus irregularis DAOM 181602=DAOM 197198]|eukprot:XP_025186379.1 hypothetical protein GLOIN_2v1765471 [Rhizophagus irregularis DAOM 181602=DAOM 197198]